MSPQNCAYQKHYQAFHQRRFINVADIRKAEPAVSSVTRPDGSVSVYSLTPKRLLELLDKAQP